MLIEATMAEFLRGEGLIGDAADATPADSLAIGLKARVGRTIVRQAFLSTEATRTVLIRQLNVRTAPWTRGRHVFSLREEV